MAHPAPPSPPWETLSSGAEPASTHPAGNGRGGGSPMSDMLFWDTYLHVVAVLQHRDLELITCKWFSPSVPCLQRRDGAASLEVPGLP